MQTKTKTKTMGDRETARLTLFLTATKSRGWRRIFQAKIKRIESGAIAVLALCLITLKGIKGRGERNIFSSHTKIIESGAMARLTWALGTIKGRGERNIPSSQTKTIGSGATARLALVLATTTKDKGCTDSNLHETRINSISNIN
jgi:hypothetical protein